MNSAFLDESWTFAQREGGESLEIFVFFHVVIAFVGHPRASAHRSSGRRGLKLSKLNKIGKNYISIFNEIFLLALVVIIL